MTNIVRVRQWLETRHALTYVQQKPLHKRIVERVTLPVYLGLACGAGILIGRFL